MYCTNYNCKNQCYDNCQTNCCSPCTKTQTNCCSPCTTTQTNYCSPYTTQPYCIQQKCNVCPVSVGPPISAVNSNGAIINNCVLHLEVADAIHPGIITASDQIIGGNKTFTGTITAANISGTNTGDITIGGVVNPVNSNGLLLSGQVLSIQSANATFPGIVTTGAQTFAGTKTFANDVIIQTGGLTLPNSNTLSLYLDSGPLVATFSGPWLVPQNTTFNLIRINNKVIFSMEQLNSAPALNAAEMDAPPGTIPVQFLPTTNIQTIPLIVVDNGNKIAAIQIFTDGGMRVYPNDTLVPTTFSGLGSAGFFSVSASWRSV